ncbi:hypothetical protein Hanom_Chr07g00657051 [Helianthus anomalus]
METWVGSLSQTGFTGNFTVVPTGGWVTGFFPGIGGGLGLLSEYSVCPVGAPRVLGIEFVGRSKKKFEFVLKHQVFSSFALVVS